MKKYNYTKYIEIEELDKKNKQKNRKTKSYKVKNYNKPNKSKSRDKSKYKTKTKSNNKFKKNKKSKRNIRKQKDKKEENPINLIITKSIFLNKINENYDLQKNEIEKFIDNIEKEIKKKLKMKIMKYYL